MNKHAEGLSQKIRMLMTVEMLNKNTINRYTSFQTFTPFVFATLSLALRIGSSCLG
jgi:hypothetical protein